eukprot:TRINITY_DN5839_c0_g1_i2.p1 TRINITY_DN5839_c0_g1~~TRINITY_DN5839_c0_g1_i2.p1  ORF type:complete len:129 (+),score=9.64 TRINITY_DN5839_c0_g1_i2:164-550(+)
MRRRQQQQRRHGVMTACGNILPWVREWVRVQSLVASSSSVELGVDHGYDGVRQFLQKHAAAAATPRAQRNECLSRSLPWVRVQSLVASSSSNLALIMGMIACAIPTESGNGGNNTKGHNAMSATVGTA